MPMSLDELEAIAAAAGCDPLDLLDLAEYIQSAGGLDKNHSSLLTPRDGPRCIDWLESNYYTLDGTGQGISLIALEPHQKVLLWLMFQQHYATRIWSTVKKSGKTTIAAGVSRWVNEEWGPFAEVLMVANDYEQAKSRLFAAVSRSIEQTPGFDRGKHELLGPTGDILWHLTEKTLLHVPTGGAIKSISADYAGEAGSNPNASFYSELWGFIKEKSRKLWDELTPVATRIGSFRWVETYAGFCVSADTELLTAEGWKRADAMRGDEAIASLMPDNTMRYEIPSAWNTFMVKGPMVRFTHNRCEFLVTPNHRVWMRPRDREGKNGSRPCHYRFETAQDLAAGKHAAGYLQADSFGLQPQGDTKYEDYVKAKLLGYYVAEGSIYWYRWKDKKEPQAVGIFQSKSANPDTWSDIGELLVDHLCTLGDYSIGFDDHGWRINNKELAREYAQLGRSHERYVPQWIKDSNAEVQRAFLMAYLDGDGSRRGEGWQAETTSKRLVDDLMQIAVNVGLIPRCTSSRTRGGNNKEIWSVTFTVQTIHWKQVRDDPWSYEDYQGAVFCPTLENGIFYVRYNGKCHWTGNTNERGPLWDLYVLALRQGRQLTCHDLYDAPPGPAPADGSTAPVCPFEWPGIDDECNCGTVLGCCANHNAPALNLESVNNSGGLPIYINENANLLAYWDRGMKARRMPWQQGERGTVYYSAQAATERPNAYSRLHENAWTESHDAFVHIEWWDACEDPMLKAMLRADPGHLGLLASLDSIRAIDPQVAEDIAPWYKPNPTESVVLSADAAVSGDCCGLSMHTRHPHPDLRQLSVLRAAWRWLPPAGGKFNYQDTIEAKIRSLCGCYYHEALNRTHTKCNHHKTFNVVCCAYDEFQLHDVMQRLRRDGLLWCFQFGQMAPRLAADKDLHAGIQGRRALHPGAPALPGLAGGEVTEGLSELREHIQNADAKTSADEDRKIRIVKRDKELKIDLAVCLSMGQYQTLRLNLE